MNMRCGAMAVVLLAADAPGLQCATELICLVGVRALKRQRQTRDLSRRMGGDLGRAYG